MKRIIISIISCILVMVTTTGLFMGCSCSRSIDAMSAEELLDLGNKYLTDLDYDQAIVCFNKLIEIDPKNEQAHIGLADAYIGLGQMEEAITVLKEALDIVDDPNPIMEKIKKIGDDKPENDEEESVSRDENKERPLGYEVDGDTLIIDGDGEMPDYHYDEDTNNYYRDKSDDLRHNLPPWPKEGIKKIIINEGVTSIDLLAFQENYEVEMITIPASMEHIAEGALSNCMMLETIIIAENNPHYTVDENGILYNKAMTELICCPRQIQISELILPESVINIAGAAFCGCVNLKQITLPESLETIGRYAFELCSGLSGSLIIPRNVKNVGNMAFNKCEQLKALYFKGDAPAIEGSDWPTWGQPLHIKSVFYAEGTSGWDAFQLSGGGYTLNTWNPDVQWSIDENSALHISGNGAMTDYYSSGIYPSRSAAPWNGEHYTSVIIEEGITEVNGFAFYGDAVVSAVFPESLKVLDSQAFNDCNNLSALYFKGDAPENITSIGRRVTLYYIEGKNGWDLESYGMTTKTWDGGKVNIA